MPDLFASASLHCAMNDPETRIANTHPGWPLCPLAVPAQRMITDALSPKPIPPSIPPPQYSQPQ